MFNLKFAVVLLSFILYVHGSSYILQMTDIDMNCKTETMKSPLPINVISFNIWNNQLSIPGILDLSLSFNVTKKLSKNIQFSTKIERKMGPLWIDVPCVSGIGTCDKQSLCTLIQEACKTKGFMRSNSKIDQNTCPCDLDVGTYTIEHTMINLKRKKSAKLVKPIMTGQYRFKVKFVETKLKTTIGCVIGYMTLLKPNKFTL